MEFLKLGSRIIFIDGKGNKFSFHLNMNLVPDKIAGHIFYITDKANYNSKPENAVAVSAKAVTVPAPPAEGWTREELIEELNLNFFGDGTVPQVALAIVSATPNNIDAGVTTSVEVVLNKSITEITDVQTDNLNINVTGYIQSGGESITAQINPNLAEAGKAFNIRVVADGETTEWFAMNVIG